MSTQGNSNLLKGIPPLKDAFIVIVKTEWNAPIINKLESGVKKVCKAAGVATKTLVVPGAFEIPFAIKQHNAKAKQTPDAYIALGAVIKGDTPHFEYVCKAITDGIVGLNLLLAVPTIFGVLTVNTVEQALERIGGKHGHKGEEAAITAIKMIGLNRKIH